LIILLIEEEDFDDIMKREEENKMNPKSIQFSDLKVYDWNQRLQKLISPQQLLGKVKS